MMLRLSENIIIENERQTNLSKLFLDSCSDFSMGCYPSFVYLGVLLSTKWLKLTALMGVGDTCYLSNGTLIYGAA